MKQRTITNEACISGTGIHTGKRTTVRFLKAEASTGICFFRKDIEGSPAIPAQLIRVCDTNRATSLQLGESAVRTVEHVMSAIYGLGITNLRVELDNEELPVLDGSSKMYYEILSSCGMTEQNALVKEQVIQQEFVFVNSRNNSLIKILPCDEFQITYHLNYGGKIKQDLTYTFSSETYPSEIAPARTFSLLSELKYLLEKGLLSGIKATEGFAVVDDPSKIKEFAAKFSVNMDTFLHSGDAFSIIAKEKLRFPDELARHKILDIIGDFALGGHFIHGHIEAFGTGHSENIGLMKTIFGLV